MPLLGELDIRRATAVDLNATGDLASFTGLPTNILIDRLILWGWSTTPAALLAATLRDAASAGGNSLVGVIAALNTPITATTLAAVMFPSVTALGASRVVTSGALYLNVSASNGSALTANVSVLYWPL